MRRSALTASVLVGALMNGFAAAQSPVMPPYPLESTVNAALSLAAATPLLTPSGLSRSDYLPTINGIVQFFRAHQLPNGTIIDPYAGVEIQYATPCFAFACATAYSEGLDASLLPNCSAALSCAIQELATNTCADGHCVFFGKPAMFAYRILAPLVDAATKASWDAGLAALDPWRDYGFPQNNWGLVGAVGDYLRTTAGFSDNYTWWQDMLDYQLSGEGGGVGSVFTDNGLYQDHTGSAGLNPLPYDAFPVAGYLTVLLREGYNGSHAPFIREVVRRAALSHLLMQSPWGEIPTGGRSSQHQWNEAVSALAYEVWSDWSLTAGDAAGACAFKRAARLSLASVRRWQNAAGDLQIVKNHADPALRWGYEGYSFLSQYNLLPASMLSAAFMYASAATEALPECAAPADVGGFAFQLPEHELIVANAGGVYAEIETASDPHYDSTGLHRVHVNTCATLPAGGCLALHALLGPSAGPPQENGGVGVGAWWSTAADAGAIVRLGNMTYLDVAGVSFTPSPHWPTSGGAVVAFTVEYFLLARGLLVTEQYTLNQVPSANASSAPVQIDTSVALPGAAALRALARARGVALREEGAAVEEAAAANNTLTRFGANFPALVWDGASNTTIALDAATNAVKVSGPPAWGPLSQVFSIVCPGGHNCTWTVPSVSDANATIVARNGLILPVSVETTFDTSSPSILIALTPQ